MATSWRQRRTLKYIRLAAYFAAQPSTVTRLELSMEEIEAVVGDTLPMSARFPSWWRNDRRRMHSRAWLTAGWEVGEMHVGDEIVVFLRRTADG